MTCPRCGMTSHNPNDEANDYCGNCHQFIYMMQWEKRIVGRQVYPDGCEDLTLDCGHVVMSVMPSPTGYAYCSECVGDLIRRVRQ